ncbi:alpha/beta fold hydrolase [Leptospira sp. GIMC2001]|uniref:alpha/beta fold hydrolase n=1 Tax=Leptospira sp. GIMC2001 TaxID=1513297 RepID=UPI0023491557|nr:alpha/beta hydrolase [Leptospira sp. GIMC2001]WCL50713.1 alpha/beta hydrolase [Leptospira sp. GIMC2001]
METGLIEVEGIKIHYRLRGDGEPLLLLHGFTGASTDWQWVFEEPPIGYKLLEVDLRGHGLTTSSSHDFTFRQCAKDVIGVLSALKLKSIKAIGFSGGGQTLLHIATTAPEFIDSMVLVSSGHYFPDAARKYMTASTIESKSDADWQEMRRKHLHGDEQIRSLWSIGHSLKYSHEDVNFNTITLSLIKNKTLLVFGDRDPLYPIEIPIEMYKSIPNSYLWIVPNEGHAPIFGAAAPRFRKTALSFLNNEWS